MSRLCDNCFHRSVCGWQPPYAMVCEHFLEIDAVPVVHGHWVDAEVIGVDTPTVRCSVCRMRFCDLINNHRYMYRYCPYCGATMDEAIE